MTRTIITSAQCRAARALADISRAQLSGIAVVPRVVIEEFEAGMTTPNEDDLASIRRALEAPESNLRTARSQA